MNGWSQWALREIAHDQLRTGETHLLKVAIPGFDGIDFYLKDESTHPTGSLKHRVARSLFTHAIKAGKINARTPVVEASSGNTAVSEAYFAKLLGLPFTAVMPVGTSRKKVHALEMLGGRCHFVEDAAAVYAAAEAIAKELSGHYMDQFAFAAQATDWRGEENVAASLLRQMKNERYSVPAAVVMSAGTGGTSATLGRHFQYKSLDTRLIVVDPEYSVFFDSYQTSDRSLTLSKGSRIEGIGRPQVEKSFMPECITQMLKVPDAASVASMYWFERLTGRRVGASTGTHLWGVLQVASRMRERQETGAIVTLICDDGARYEDSYWDREWVDHHIGSISNYLNVLQSFL
ncbi:PLP-dependent cysteine synthase family protein [Pseudomonas guariconensis]|uniref:PLP-dependent cysteine synthase family protein n=1 Tax=Pseudomonas guariconensis TaxID=1288410 RepID=UPI0018A9FB71|nr:PLP-dependent cysteine synthase family protein [Pseudomonas guariconensis]MBF8741906.1 PLP-dependent cysteine synthase family protein [Pseudomonas guariconensis]MBF8750880.1 PLP-dependent cysteine synthase family protein [Pseudomonas guariconensis]